MTTILRVDAAAPDPELIDRAAQALLAGQVVAFPTETVYGLGANALDAAAVRRIFAAKERPEADPLIVHLATAQDLPQVAQSIPPLAQQLAQVFWPGPLTLILPKQPQVPEIVTAGLPTVAVRVPAHPVALALLRRSGVPIAAPSANRFGSVSPTTAQHVLSDLGGRIDLILDGGPTVIGVESTVLDISQVPPLILRPGGVSREALEAVIGPVQVRPAGGHSAEEQVAPQRTSAPQGTSAPQDLSAPQSISAPQGSSAPQVSPGLFEKHYAPRAELLLVIAASLEAGRAEVIRLAREALAAGKRVGLLIAAEDEAACRDLPAPLCILGGAGDLDAVARHLYAGLRELDAQGVQVIVGHDFGEQGLGLAIRDRLRRAATRVITLPGEAET